MSDAFTRDKLAWLERISVDPDLSANAVRLALVLATRFLNRETGDAWPTHGTLAEAIGTSDRTIRTLVEELVDAGHLEVIRGRGRNRPNRYRPIIENRKPASAQEEGKTGSPLPHKPSGKPEAGFTKTGKSTSEKQEASFLRIPMKEPIEEPSEGILPSLRQDAAREQEEEGPPVRVEKQGHDSKPPPPPVPGRTPSGAALVPFASKPPPEAVDEAWRQVRSSWPNQGSSWREAERIFRRDIRRGVATADEILAGAVHYAAVCQHRRPEHVADLANWLGRGDWEKRSPIRRDVHPTASASGFDGALGRILNRRMAAEGTS